MSEKEEALLLMTQGTLMLYPDRGQAQVTPAEWLKLCDELLKKSQSLGQIGKDLARRREKIQALVSGHSHDQSFRP